METLDRELEILFEDERVLAVNKPSGLLVHRGLGRDRTTLADLAREIVGAQVFAAHRLDRGTSGALVFAKDGEAAGYLARQFREGAVQKRYLALVRGRLEDGIVDHPLASKPGGEKKPATTVLRCLSTRPTEPRHSSWVEARPKTGRFHQVRRHLKHLSHPVLGDANYGKGALNRDFAERYGLRRLALHAASLVLEHPSGGSLELEAPLSEDLAVPLQRMGHPFGLAPG